MQANPQPQACPFHTPSDIDFMDPRVQENWFDAYDVLREDAPVYFMPEIGMYVVTRYDDLEAIIRNPQLFATGTDLQAVDPLIKHPENRALYEAETWPRGTTLGQTRPRHLMFREVVDRVFTMAEVKRREPFIRETIETLVDGWIDRGRIEFVHDFAEPLPMMVIAHVLGFPAADLPQLKEWSEAWVRPFARGLTLEVERWAVRKHIELQRYIAEAIRAKRANPQDDVLTYLTQVEIDDVDTGEHRPLTKIEIIGLADHLLSGGNETTTFALTNGMWLLFRFPEVQRQLRADRSKIRTFVEETLRLESPTQGMYRIVQEETALNGVTLPKGALLSIRFGAANRDPRRFPDPAKLDLARKNAGRHFAFNIGEHHCPGASLSRVEQACSWEILLDRVRDFRPAPENTYEHIRGMWIRALKELHVEFEKATHSDDRSRAS